MGMGQYAHSVRNKYTEIAQQVSELTRQAYADYAILAQRGTTCTRSSRARGQPSGPSGTTPRPCRSPRTPPLLRPRTSLAPLVQTSPGNSVPDNP
eukprot:1287887-Rhodomonas_salina.2